MIVAIDARFVTRNPRGIGIYSENLIFGLLRERPDWKYYLYIRPNSPLLDKLKDRKQIVIRTLPPLGYVFEEFIFIPFFLHLDRPNIFHATGNTGPIFRISRNFKSILTLHDVSFMKPRRIVPWPKRWYPRFGRVYRKIVAPLTARNSDKIITVSEFAAKDIRFTLRKIVEGKLQTCFLGFDSNAPELSEHCCDDKEKHYAIVVSGNDPQKNLDWLLRAFVRYRKQGGSLELKVIGVSEDDVSDVIAQSCADFGISFLGYVNHNQTIELIKRAYLLLFPSLYESFGIPIIEAFRAGTPVLAANTGAAPEVGGEAACYFKSGDVDDFVSKLFEIEINQNWRDHLSKLGRERAQMFTQKQMALCTIKIYEDACGLSTVS